MTKKIAAVQMTSTADVNENLLMAGRLIKEAAEAGATLVVLPEMFPLFGKNPDDRVMIAETQGTGQIQDCLSEVAQANHIWIVGGTLPLKTNAPNKVRAASIVFDANGKQVARYDKIHLFDAQLGGNDNHNESSTVQPGEQVVVVDTPVGKVGLSVCFDIRFSFLYREFLEKGVEVLIVPAAFTVPTGQAHWEVLARARAIESVCYFVGACQGGKHENGRETYGHSLIVDPWGKIIAELDNHSTGMITAPVDLDYLYQQRKKLYGHRSEREL